MKKRGANKTKTQTPKNIKKINSESGDIFSLYENHSKAVRSWMIAYGAGVPTIIISQRHLLDKMTGSGWGFLSLSLFLTGALLVVISSFINAWVSWIVNQLKYSKNKEFFLFNPKNKLDKNSKISIFATWWYEQIGLEIVFYLAIFIFYIVATLLLFSK